jgi:outer membrane protein assembly factor BamB
MTSRRVACRYASDVGQRRAAPDSYRFDLVADDVDPGRNAADVDAPGVEPPPTVMDRVRAWPRRRVIAGLVAVAVVLGGGGVASAVSERQRVAALRSAPGGVADLSQAPTESWSVDVVNGTPLTMLGDLVVVVAHSVEDRPTPADPGEVSDVQLRAIDPEDGTEAWRRSFQGQWGCGPGARYSLGRIALGTSESVVCVEAGPDGTVQVIDAAGDVTAEREVLGTDARLPAAHGGLVRIEQVGEPGQLPEVVGDEMSGFRPDGPVVAPDVHVTMEDAATGETRWETTVDSLPTGEVNWQQCARWEGESAAKPELDPMNAPHYHWADDTVVVVGTCGVDAAFTPSGVRLDLQSGTADEIATGAPASYELVRQTSDGYYVRPGEVDSHGQYSQSLQAPWDVVDADGSVIASLPGQTSEPSATDGSRPEVVFTHVPDGLAAVRLSDGETLWEQRLRGPVGVLVRTRDLVVVVTAEHELVAIDLDSGERRWSAEVEGSKDGGWWGDASSLAHAAFTDGRIAVVGTPGAGVPGAPTWTAFDLRSGDVVWTWRADGAGGGSGFAVDGRMFYWDNSTLTALE